ncbi:MAG: GIY-YIG nuclease family protein [Candidatus Bipolaricaulota bacterium]
MNRYPKGIYVLRIQLEEPKELKIGSLTTEEFQGEYLYVGSALGPGGLQRVRRHIEVSNGSREGGHWHIDYLTRPGRIVESWLIPTEEDLECSLAEKLQEAFDQPVKEFGASDCECYSHLFSYEDSKKKELVKKVEEIAPGAKPIRFDWQSITP